MSLELIITNVSDLYGVIYKQTKCYTSNCNKCCRKEIGDSKIEFWSWIKMRERMQQNRVW